MPKERGFLFKISTTISVGALMALALSAPAHARNDELEDRVYQLETRTSSRNDLDLMRHVDELQSQVQSLSGQLEVAMHKIEMLEERQQALYQDLDRRITKLAGTSTTNPPSAMITVPGNPDEQLMDHAIPPTPSKPSAHSIPSYAPSSLNPSTDTDEDPSITPSLR
jgi:TolA-binding protein